MNAPILLNLFHDISVYISCFRYGAGKYFSDDEIASLMSLD